MVGDMLISLSSFIMLHRYQQGLLYRLVVSFAEDKV